MNVKAGEHRRSELCGLDVTISARYNWPVACLFHYVIGISGILPYNRNVTLQTFFRSLEIFTACTVLMHGSIMLPPRQPRIFARLARWQQGDVLQNWETVRKQYNITTSQRFFNSIKSTFVLFVHFGIDTTWRTGGAKQCLGFIIYILGMLIKEPLEN